MEFVEKEINDALEAELNASGRDTLREDFVESPFSEHRKLAVESSPSRFKKYFETGEGGFILSAERSNPGEMVQLGTELNKEGKFEVLLESNNKPIPCTRRQRANHLAKQLHSRESYSRGIYFIPLFGGFQEANSQTLNEEYSFFIPYAGKNKENFTFEQLHKIVIELARAYNQDSITLLEGKGKGRIEPVMDTFSDTFSKAIVDHNTKSGKYVDGRYYSRFRKNPNKTKGTKVTFESLCGNYNPLIKKGENSADSGHIVWFTKYGGFITFDNPCFNDIFNKED